MIGSSTDTKFFVNESGEQIEDIPDGVVVYKQVKTYLVFCASKRTGTLVCCCYWEKEVNTPTESLTADNIASMLCERGWKQVDGYWMCGECAGEQGKNE